MRFPFKLKLLSSFKWRGSLTVKGMDGDKYIVHFDAVDKDRSLDSYIYDCVTVTAEQLKEMTGYTDGR